MARSKEFDEDAVLLKAMRLFWEQGYEKTSMANLVEHMGVHKRSLYDTFGDKHSLYIKALQRYSKMMEDKRIPVDNLSAAEAIRLLLETALRPMNEATPKGCLLVNTAVELALNDPECKEWVNQRMTGTEQFICELIKKGQHSGELDKTLDAEQLSRYFNNAFIGLRVMVKTTDDKERLRSIIETTMSVLKKN
ncbi:TetR/AcrR family transcriptional regulator [Paenibacillus montanisoli]|uniref:TetR/AcrR family transcriptional regulator n=1 Tax=Paenibacillus montanisoli TaxID=2081970 RepID=A0A328U3E1_9BACL|nr:TetR/AcrR family transcriptional regulator [Paenibacillus montanisoli]RAP74504.1 TetR/AcrR family transcriptional regulator [Paenibacillus montanisoli]